MNSKVSKKNIQMSPFLRENNKARIAKTLGLTPQAITRWIEIPEKYIAPLSQAWGVSEWHIRRRELKSSYLEELAITMEDFMATISSYAGPLYLKGNKIHHFIESMGYKFEPKE